MPGRTPGSRHVAGRGASKLKRDQADLDESARAIGEKDHFRGHLLREASGVGASRPKAGYSFGKSSRPRPSWRIVPAFVWRRSAEVMAGG